MTNEVAAPRAQNPLVAFKTQLDQRADQFRSALPVHIPPERFQRVVLTAVQRNPDLLDADRQSLFNAAMQAAQDGLLPDGREGAIVTFNTKVKRRKAGTNAVEEVSVILAQWMPMIGGIRKKARNSGELAGIAAHVVFHADTFRFWVDEGGQHLNYEPADNPPVITSANAAKEVRLVFAWARTKDGEFFVERMTPGDIEKVRSISRAKDGQAWSKWWDQMAIKTVVRRLAKVLPMSSDLDDLIRRDDELYDLEAKPAPAVLDLGARGPELIGGPSEPPESSADGDRGSPDIGSRPGGSDAASPSADTDPGDPVASPLEQSIAETLIDCKTLRDCDGVKMLFQKEITEAGVDFVKRVDVMIDERKAAIRDDAGFFPGDAR